MDWSPPRGYKGFRTNFRHVVDVHLTWDSKDPHGSKQRRYNAEDWCEENCHHHWSFCGSVFWFESVKEAVLFKMIWGGK